MIGIVFAGNLKFCPYLMKYISELEATGIAYEIISWDRDGSDDGIALDKIHLFDFQAEQIKNPWVKVLDFIKFRRFAIKIIQKKKYEKLIVLNTPTAVFMFDKLLRNYKGKYIFDYRDYSYEHFKPYYWILERVIKNAAMNVVSSTGFLRELPQGEKYILSHNFRHEDVAAAKAAIRKERTAPFNITYIGEIRYYEHVVKLIELVEKDSRFEFHIIGESPISKKVQKYVAQKAYTRTKVLGRYDNSEKAQILSNVDVLFNSYSGGRNAELLVSNKFYDGLIYRIPQIVCGETYSQELVEKLGIGIVLDFNDIQAMDKLYEYLDTLDKEKFYDHCSTALESIQKEDAEYLLYIQRFITA